VNIYYTSQLRPNNAMVLMVGQMYLNIPPETTNVSFSGSCISDCSNMMTIPTINIAGAVLHMHLLGYSGTVQYVKSGQAAQYIIEVPSYSYNSPELFTYDPPLQFSAGDQLIVNCVYQSIGTNTTTMYGQSTEDEMCYSFVTMYPAVSNFQSCMQWKDVNLCSLSGLLTYQLQNCDIATFETLLTPVATVCNMSTCAHSKACQLLIQDLMTTGCLNGSLYQWIQQFWPEDLPGINVIFKMVNYCAGFIPTTATTTTTTTKTSLIAVSTPANVPAQPQHTNAAVCGMDRYQHIAFVSILLTVLELCGTTLF